MPYRSAKQRAYFHVAEARGEISPATVDEFDRASKGKKLPERVGDRKVKKKKKAPEIESPAADAMERFPKAKKAGPPMKPNLPPFLRKKK